MNVNQRTLQLETDIHRLIERYEAETGMVVNKIEMRRGGITEDPPYDIWGIRTYVHANNRWKPKQVRVSDQPMDVRPRICTYCNQPMLPGQEIIPDEKNEVKGLWMHIGCLSEQNLNPDPHD
jgi:hypothetical protein